MNRFAIVVIAAGLAVSSALASQGRGQFDGEGGSAALVPELVHLAGTARRGGSSYGSPGVMGASFELMATEKVTVLEEHYRKQLTVAGWRIESTGGDANGAFSRFAVAAGAGTRVGTLRVAPMQTGWVSVAIRLIESTPPPPPPSAKTESETMDWMLRQLPPSETPAVASALPSTFPTELLPGRFKSSRILTSSTRVTVAGTVDNTAPSELGTFFVGLRKAGWISSPSRGFTSNFALGRFCRNETVASFVFYVEPKRVVMAAVSTDTSPNVGCAVRAKQSSDFFVPIVVVTSSATPVIDGGGGGSHSRSGIRVSTSAPIASVLADFESQITVVGYKAISRANDATQSLVRFESTPEAGSPAMLILSLTKLPWSSQVDAVFDVIASPVR